MSDDVIGCGDSGCVFGRGPGTRFGGQHTNGGCRCLEDERTGRQFSFEAKKRLRDWIRALRQQRDEARETLVKALHEGLADRKRLTAERDEAREALTEARRQAVLAFLGVESEDDLCKRCGGRGRRTYGSTATWHGGVGGQMATEDACNGCWGSGRSDRKGFNLRRLAALRAEIDGLTRERDEARAEVERLRGELDAFQRLASPPCSDYTCDQDGVMGPCSEAPGKTCIECCPMHRCGGEA